jgi:protein TonB
VEQPHHAAPEVKPVPPAVVQSRAEPTVIAPAVQNPPAPVQQAPAPPVVAVPPKPVDPNRERAVTEQYRQMISAWIKKYGDQYPPLAKKRHWEGTTVVQLQFTSEGKVADISVVEKSGHDILDDAAIKMIRNAAPLPVPPEGLRTVLVPIRFRLDS